MKRLIALIAILAMSIQLGVYAADTDNVAGEENIGYQSRLELLRALDIIEDSDISSDETISRAKFIATILNFSNNRVHPDDATGNTFADVDKDYTYAAQIERGAELGYMTGYSDGKFYPESPITYTQAIKVIVSMLGYDVYASQRGGYPNGYLTVANSIGLLDGVKQLDGDLTMLSLVTLLCNAGECPVVEYDVVDQTYATGDGDNDTAFYYFHRIAKVRGVVTVNDVTGLENETEALPEGQVMIDGEAMNAGLTDAKNMLGYSVTAYVYYENEYEMGEIKYIEADPRNSVLTINARDILSDDSDFSGTNFVYENENGSRRTIAITADASIIFNGKAKLVYSVSDLAVKVGDITFIDNDDDGVYECINIFSATKVIIPESIADNDASITLVDYFDTNNMYSYDKDYKYYDIVIDGEKAGYGNIKTDMIVLIGENNTEASQHSVTRAYSKDTKISGIVNSVSEDEIKINGTSYGYSAIFDNSQIRPNSVGYFWVYDGDVYGYQKTDVEIDGEMVYVNDYEYGYMISCVYADEGEPDPFLQLEILTSYNEFEKYRTTDYTIYNGKRITDRYEAAKIFAESWSGDTFKFKDQLVKYKLDEDNNIKEIYTADYPEQLKYEGSVDTQYKDENNKTVIRVEKDGVVSLIDKSNIAQYGFYVDTWLNFFYQGDDTVVFHINDSDLESSYASGKFPSAEPPNEGNFLHEFYNIDENKNTVSVVVWHSSVSQERQQVSRGVKPMVVTKVKEVVNSDDEVVKALEGSMDGATVEIQYNDDMTDINKQIFDSIGVGDIIFYDLDGRGNIQTIEKSFDAKRIGEYGMSNNAQFDAVHDQWSPPVHLGRKVGYFRIEEKLHNNFYSYKNGDGALCIQLVDTAAKFYKMSIIDGQAFVNEITYNEVFSGDEVFAVFEYNKLQYMYVIDAE